jgi:hypothetical protein
MDTPGGSKQRSPWFYVLLGCGGLAALICLGTMVALFGLGRAVKNITAGVNDPSERQANALKQLGAIPDGYNVVASLSVFGLMQTTVLTDRPMQPDGGFILSPDGHTFSYFRVIANENNQKARDFISGKDTDPEALAKSGINVEAKDVVKRGQLTVDGRKVWWVTSRGRLDTGNHQAVEGLNNAILFDCPGDALQVGIWSQLDPDPEKPPEELDLAGTVADEAEMVRFLKPMNPCGK